MDNNVLLEKFTRNINDLNIDLSDCNIVVFHSGGYGDKIVVRDIDLVIDKGEFVSVLGPNGAGKSTLLKILTCNIVPESGSIQFNGRDLSDYKKQELARKFSVVHQLPEEMLPFSVHEFVRMGRYPHQKTWEIETETDKEIIKDAMEQTGVSELGNRILTELSGGERQLVFIARALVQNREVIILDEPISHLDIKHSVDVMDILYKLNKEGATVITVLHDINVSSDYCSRIVSIKNGKIFFNGSPETVLKYDLLEELYDTACIVNENPTSKKPYIYPVPEYLRK